MVLGNELIDTIKFSKGLKKHNQEHHPSLSKKDEYAFEFHYLMKNQSTSSTGLPNSLKHLTRPLRFIFVHG